MQGIISKFLTVLIAQAGSCSGAGLKEEIQQFVLDCKMGLLSELLQREKLEDNLEQ
jgi:hypothetical protein